MRYLAPILLLLALPALAHDGHNDDWLKTLSSRGGGTCCDGNDAYSVLDPDWWIAGDHYVVRLSGQEIKIPDDRIVKEPNKIGIAKVWPVFTFGKIEIRCFLPGSGS